MEDKGRTPVSLVRYLRELSVKKRELEEKSRQTLQEGSFRVTNSKDGQPRAGPMEQQLVDEEWESLRKKNLQRQEYMEMIKREVLEASRQRKRDLQKRWPEDYTPMDKQGTLKECMEAMNIEYRGLTVVEDSDGEEELWGQVTFNWETTESGARGHKNIKSDRSWSSDEEDWTPKKKKEGPVFEEAVTGLKEMKIESPEKEVQQVDPGREEGGRRVRLTDKEFLNIKRRFTKPDKVGENQITVNGVIKPIEPKIKRVKFEK